MKKLFLSMSMISMIALLPAALQAGQYEQRVIATTTILGATTGAIIGSGNDQTAQGAVLGALAGAAVGILMAEQPCAGLFATAPDGALCRTAAPPGIPCCACAPVRAEGDGQG